MSRPPLEIHAQLESGLALFKGGKLDEAEAVYRSVIVADPDNPYAHNLLGLLLKRRGNLVAAIECVQRAIALDANRPGFRSNLGGLLSDLGDFAGAADAYGQAARLQPDSIEAVFNHGVALNRVQRHAEAEALFRRVLDIQPNFVFGLTSLAGSLSALGRFAEAEEAAKRAIVIQEDNVDAWINLGHVQLEQGKLAAAEQSNRHVLNLAPGQAQAAYNLGCALQYQWRCDEAVVAYRQATSMDPEHEQAWSNQLMLALYDPNQTERSIFESSRQWAQQMVNRNPGHLFRTERPKSGEAGRRLRIGYVSPDFKSHSCSSFLKPLFRAHDASEVEIFAYANVQKEDEVTQWFREHVDHWRDIYPLTHEAAAQQVHSDRIDILVDLAGHTIDSPIGLFRFKPAPIQVSWLGYPATSGMEQIDYRLTDALADPVGEADKFHVEKLVRLEGGFLCYAPRYEAPEVSELPAEKNKLITFGSFNSLDKVTPEVINAWVKILQIVPGSRLIMKGWKLNYAETRDRVEAAFVMHGIESQRIELHGWMPAKEYLELYHQVDISLDSFPYNGTTTTFESLWMGVPVINLLGDRHAGRVGASILTYIGHAEWIAEDTDDYIRRAQHLAEDVVSLKKIRTNLRSIVQRSSLCEQTGFARKLERAYRKMWHDHLG